MSDLNVWEWLMIICISLMIIIPTIIQAYSYLKQIRIKGKWYMIFGIWGFFTLLIIIFALIWWKTST